MSTSPRGRGHRRVKTWLFPSALGEAASACPTETIASRGWHDVIKNFWSVNLQQKIQNSELLGVGRWLGETSAIEDDLESQLLESKDCAVPTSCTRNSQHRPRQVRVSVQPPGALSQWQTLAFSSLFPPSRCSVNYMIGCRVPTAVYWNVLYFHRCPKSIVTFYIAIYLCFKEGWSWEEFPFQWN